MSGSGSTCKSTHLMELEGSRRCVDYQEVKIQDHIDRLNVGRVPRSITVLVRMSASVIVKNLNYSLIINSAYIHTFI